MLILVYCYSGSVGFRKHFCASYFTWKLVLHIGKSPHHTTRQN